jgi:hypothetical protein
MFLLMSDKGYSLTCCFAASIDIREGIEIFKTGSSAQPPGDRGSQSDLHRSSRFFDAC